MRSRSMVVDFAQGTIDRTYIQYAPDRGGLVELDWPLVRAEHYEWPSYVNAGVRGPGPFDQARRRVMDSRIQEPVSTQPIQNRWLI